MARIFNFIVDANLEIVWEKTLQFLQGKVTGRFHISGDTFFISRGMSMSGCTACSYGERYQLRFFTVENEPNKTQVHVSVGLNLGTGVQWKIASDFLKEWALFVGTYPQEFGQTWYIIARIISLVAILGLVIVIIVFSLTFSQL